MDDFTRLVIAVFLTPAPFELAIGIVKRESYDYRRLLIIVATLTALSLLLGLVRRRTWWYPQILVGYYVAIIGAVMTGFGVAATIWDETVRTTTRWSSGVELTVTALATSFGVLLIVSGIYLIRDRRQRAMAELDTPVPARASMARMTPLQQYTAAVWTSDDTTRQRGRDILVGLCQSALSVADLHYVAYYTKQAECDFYVDLFDDDALALLATGDTAERRISYIRHSRHIRHQIARIAIRMSDLDTGPIVRVILDVEKGAILYYDLGNQGFLIGVTLDQQRVDPSDWKMSELSNAVLRAFGRHDDDDFYRHCPQCGQTNRDRRHSAGDAVPIQRPRTDTG